MAKSELEIYSTQQDSLKKQENEAKENLENGKEKVKDLKRFECFTTDQLFVMNSPRYVNQLDGNLLQICMYMKG